MQGLEKLYKKGHREFTMGFPGTIRHLFLKKHPQGISFPKSGRTWLRKMLFDLHVDLPCSHAGSNLFEFGRAVNLNRIVNHFDKSVLFLTRDPRDVLVSYHKDLTLRQKVYHEDVFEMAKNPQVGIDAICAFNMHWLDNSQKFRAFHHVTYEALRAAPEQELMNICRFLGAFWVSEKRVATIVQNSSFARMKDQERKGELAGKYPTYWFNGASPTAHPKVRRGKVGGFRSELPGHALQYCDRRLAALEYPTDLLAQSLH